MDSATSPIRPLAGAVESISALDAPGKKIGEVVRGLLSPGALKDAVSGTWMGHALHPILTDVVIGSFVSASLLDLLGGDEDGRAAERLLGVGIAAYGPTALTGVSDWADSEIGDERIRRVGLVHAVSNAVALGLYTASLRARRRGDHGRGKLLALAGGGAMGAGGYLGGHLAFVQGVGVKQTVFDEGSPEWSSTGMAADDLPAGKPTRVVVDETPVMLLRHGDAFHALHDRCAHRGCPLSDMGEIDGEVIECTCHGSRFSLRDGSLQRGPATTDQPSYEVRDSGGQLEVRLSPARAG
ncbi:MAG: Rieske 2Fe-2S domain-containing protein [Thermoleophilaceae bacterium]